MLFNLKLLLKLHLHKLGSKGIPDFTNNTVPDRNNRRLKKRRLVSTHRPVTHHSSQFATSLAFTHLTTTNKLLSPLKTQQNDVYTCLLCKQLTWPSSLQSLHQTLVCKIQTLTEQIFWKHNQESSQTYLVHNKYIYIYIYREITIYIHTQQTRWL